MKCKCLALLIALFLSGCVSYNKFVNYEGADSSSIKIVRPASDMYQTGIRIVSEGELKLKGRDRLDCYVESEKYWKHVESLGHWRDKPDIFEVTLDVIAEKQYLFVKNWVLGQSCGGVYEFTPEKGKGYILEITGLMPSCLMNLKPIGDSIGKFDIKKIPECF